MCLPEDDSECHPASCLRTRESCLSQYLTIMWEALWGDQWGERPGWPALIRSRHGLLALFSKRVAARWPWLPALRQRFSQYSRHQRCGGGCCSLRKASNCSAVSGLEKRNPCPLLQPIATSFVRCFSVSIPSAVVARPGCSASLTTVFGNTEVSVSTVFATDCHHGPNCPQQFRAQGHRKIRALTIGAPTANLM